VGPAAGENPAAARVRRNLVLQRMADLGMVSIAEARKAEASHIRLAHKRAPAGTGFHHAPYFCNAVLEQLRERYGDDLLFKGGVKVYTTPNWQMHQHEKQAIRPRLVRDGFGPLLIFFAGWKLFGLGAGIVSAVIFGLAVFAHERRQGRPATVIRLALVLVAIRATVGIVSGRRQ